MDIQFFKKRNQVRNYLHFDKKISAEKLFNYISDPEKISKHSFFPTISYSLKEQKISRVLNRRYLKVNGSSLVLNKDEDFYKKNRLINFPSHIDGNIYAYYSKNLEEKYELFLKNNNMSENIIAFRRIIEKNEYGKSYSLCNIHFAKNVFSYIENKKNCFVLCLDISNFFNELDHIILKTMWLVLLGKDSLPVDHYKVYKSLCSYAYVDKKELYKSLGLSINSKTLHRRLDRLCNIKEFNQKVREKKLIKKNLKKKGIPQGSPISGMLSNIYMMDFDKALVQKLNEVNGKYYRYCDDMIFIFDEDQSKDMLVLIESEIEKLKLKVNNKKTQHMIFQDGTPVLSNIKSFTYPSKLQYLGLEYDGKKVFLREHGIAKFHKKLRKSIRMNVAHYKKIKSSEFNVNKNINKKTLYKRYTYIGKNNYISYAFRVAKEFNSKNVKQQVSGHLNIFNNYLDKKLDID